MAATEEDFKLVIGKSKTRRKVHLNFKATNIDDNHPIFINETVLLRRLESIQHEHSFSSFYIKSKKIIQKAIELNNKDIVKVICFGLGSFSRNLSSLHQLAFIMEIRKYFSILNIEMYDPVFNEMDKKALKTIGCKILDENCEGKYEIDCTVLFYLPHCPKQLINNLLWCNWNSMWLPSMILISNSFENLKINTPERCLQQDAEYILKISNHTTEYPLENDYKFSDIFNDTSVHVFCAEKLKNVPIEFWIKNDEPKYCDTELITRNKT